MSFGVADGVSVDVEEEHGLVFLFPVAVVSGAAQHLHYPRNCDAVARHTTVDCVTNSA